MRSNRLQVKAARNMWGETVGWTISAYLNGNWCRQGIYRTHSEAMNAARDIATGGHQ